eukprot:246955_1
MVNPVYFYYPNIIGYSRVILLFMAGYYTDSNALLAVVCYSLSMGLDAIDGTVARRFNQCSSFGAQLDMLSDRMTTTCLYVLLARMYPDYWYLSALAIMLDIVSHWMHMMSKTEAGNKSHKTARNLFLKYYYQFPYFMLTLCIGQELFLGAYFLKPYLSKTVPWAHDMLMTSPIWHILFVLYSMKQLANFIQLIEAADYYASKDLAEKQGKIRKESQ